MSERITIQSVNEIFKQFAEKYRYYFDSAICVAAGWEYDVFIEKSAIQSPALLYAFTDIQVKPENLQNGIAEGFTEKWSIYPYKRVVETRQGEKATVTQAYQQMNADFIRAIYMQLRTYYEDKTFVIDNSTSDLDGYEVYGDLLTGSASYKADSKGVISEEYQIQLELTFYKN